ncbi:hypothetical protein HYPSUDRAFT_38049 [Hypholoma sublateritium FD-334 SS-4]|uniref:Transmembrane protein n=1 Tax=Hypholoma sublateritium (strain FD-334 SS-4) TaxID=945553 RepID=A0A0D2Q0K5_HYPSF|nr:hypothetical protein HYPSUDRAFT_38049 [Hypholoma sublateritium FD-334 SS-4]
MTTPSSQVSKLIIDDSSDAYFFYPNASASSINTMPFFYAFTEHVSETPIASSGGATTFVEILFDGTEIAIFGYTAPPSSSLSGIFTVIIDGGIPYTTSYSDPAPPSYRQWYQSPLLEQGTHNITLSNVLGAAIDFAVVTADISFDVIAETGQTVVVDDTDPAIAYGGGGWSLTNATFASDFASAVSITPYGNYTHETSTVGDAFQFNFTGNALTVYGVLEYQHVGNLNLTATLDGVSQSIFFDVVPKAEATLEGVVQSNFPLYRTPANTTAAPHILLVEVAGCENLTLIVDYITYTPTEAAATVTAPSAPSSRKSHAGAIAGGIVGGLVFLLIATLLLHFFRHRRRQLQFRSTFMHPFPTGVRSGSGIPLASIANANAGFTKL